MFVTRAFAVFRLRLFTAAIIATLLATAVIAINPPAASAQAQTPYRTHIAPGTIQAEHYDIGGQGVAFSDTTTGNSGRALRNDRVDVYQKVGEQGYAVGALGNSEWLEFTVEVRQTGSYILDARLAADNNSPGGLAISIDGTFLKTINARSTGGEWEWERFVSPTTNLTAGRHLFRLSFVNTPSFNFDSFQIRLADDAAPTPAVVAPTSTPAPTVTPAPVPAGQSPYRTHSVPGTMQAEHYDRGGPGVAYSDSDVDNRGGALRADQVDVWAKVGESGYTVGRSRDGEWLEYTVQVATTGAYVFDARVASGAASPGSIRTSVDGRVVGELRVANTGGWWTWDRIVSSPTNLSAGRHVIRMTFANNPRINLDSFDMRLASSELAPTATPTATAPPAATPTPQPPPANGQSQYTALAAPGVIQAEFYDLGGPGIAYADSDMQNQGGALRSDRVDVWETVGEDGHTVGRSRDGEWLEYTIDVTETNSYIFDARLASGAAAPGSLQVSIDGRTLSTITIPNTGGWWTFDRVSSSRTTLSEGRHLIRLSFLNNPRINIDSFDLRLAFAAPTATPRPTATATPQPAPTVAPPPAAGTVRVRVTDSLGSMVRNNPEGTTFLFDEGVHTNKMRIVPRNNQKFIGSSAGNGTILDGGNVGSTLFGGNADGVEIRNFEIRNYRPGLYNAPISPRNLATYKNSNHNDGWNWVIADNEIHNNDGAGVSLANGMRVENNKIYRNRQIGISGIGSENNPLRFIKILNNEINGNTEANPLFQFEFHEGGIKATYAENMEVRGNNIHDNRGAGMYCDLFCDTVTVDGNRFTNNGGRQNGGGVFFEIGANATITNNIIDGVGSTFVEAQPLWGGITIAESQNVTVANNTIRINGAVGIMFRNGTNIRDNAGNLERDALANVEFRDNSITATSGETRVGFGGGTTLPSGAVRMVSNDYATSGNGSIRLTYVGEKTWSYWQNTLGYDTGGTFN